MHSKELDGKFAICGDQELSETSENPQATISHEEPNQSEIAPYQGKDTSRTHCRALCRPGGWKRGRGYPPPPPVGGHPARGSYPGRRPGRGGGGRFLDTLIRARCASD